MNTNLFRLGDEKKYTIIVKDTDIAKFESGVVHEVYSTFALCRDAEWSGRLFVLDMKNEDEEGIGTFINVVHHSPAFIGQEVTFVSTFMDLKDNEVTTTYTCMVGDRLIANGEQRQRILSKEFLDNRFTHLKAL